MTEQLRVPADAPISPPRRNRLWLLMLILLGGCALALYQSDMLRLGEVRVTGNQQLTTQRVMDAARLTPGAPRWANSSLQIESRLRQEPWVKTATVGWTWNQLGVEVTERTPVALLPYQSWWVTLDESGMVLEVVESPAVQKLPVVSGVNPGRVLRGEQVSQPGLNDALFMLGWTASPLRSQISEVHVAPDRVLTLYMLGGAVVRWGQLTEGKERLPLLKEKLELFGEVWRTVAKGRLTSCVIDLRIPGKGIPSGCQSVK